MIVPVIDVADSVIGKTCLPNVAFPLQLFAGLKGKSSFDKLNGTLKRNLRAEEKVDVVWHDDEIVQAYLRQVMLKSFQEETRPHFVAKEALAASCLKANEVGLVCLPENFSGGPHPFPPGLKPLYS